MRDDPAVVGLVERLRADEPRVPERWPWYDVGGFRRTAASFTIRERDAGVRDPAAGAGRGARRAGGGAPPIPGDDSAERLAAVSPA